MLSTLNELLMDVASERRRQDELWGQQDHPSVDPVLLDRGPQRMADEYGIPTESRAKFLCNCAEKKGTLTFSHIAVEELAEVVGAPDDKHRLVELIQLAAVCLSWAEAIKRRS